jgi:DNA-directed RNA polymerase specialized sigma24 family protein
MFLPLRIPAARPLDRSASYYTSGLFTTGKRARVELFDVGTMPDDQELLALDEALRRLAEEDALAAEVVNLKFFAGVSREAIAEMTGLTIHEVRLKWS